MNHPNDQIVRLIEKLNTNEISNKNIRTYSNSSNAIISLKLNKEGKNKQRQGV